MADHSEEHHHPIDSAGTYIGILATLLALTIVTTAVAYVDLGALSTIVANRIATVIWVRIFNEDPPD